MLLNSLAVAMLLGPGPVAEGPFQDLTLDQALAAAKRDGRVVMIDFFTTWCVPCKKLDKITWTDPEVVKWLGEKTVALKMDAEKEVEVAKRFGVSAYPTIVFIQADGKKIDQIVGFKEPKEFLEAAKATLSGKDSVTRAKEKVAGHEKDPIARGQYANELARAGRYEEALTEYLWCFDHGNDNEWNGYGGVRLSFLLGDIHRLGQKYPPAIQALEERRDKAETAVLSGKGTWQDAADMTALDRELGAHKRILSVYDRLKAENRLDENGKEALIREIAELLVEAKRYSDLVEDAGDVEKRVAQEIAITKMRPKTSSGDDEGFRKSMEEVEIAMRAMTVTRLSLWYEALLGVGQKEKASGVADQLISFAPVGATYSDLIKHAVRANAPEAARAIADRGRTSLPDKEKAALEAAAMKIPATK